MINHLYILIKLCPDKDWNWRSVVRNVNITREMIDEIDIKNNLQLLTSWYGAQAIRKMKSEWRANEVGEPLTNMTIEKALSEHPTSYDSDWHILSKNRNISIPTIREHLARPWNWYFITRNRSWSTILANPDLPWDPYILSISDELRISYIKALPNIKWDWRAVSSNLCITWPDIINNLELPWKWNELSKHINITYDIIERHPELPWNYAFISENPNITAKIVIDNIDKDWRYLSLARNKFNRDIEFIVRKLARKWLSNIIKKRFKKSYQHVLDMLNMRIRDYECGIRIKMI